MRICGGQSTEWSAKIANFVKLEPSVFWVNMSNCQQVNQNMGMVLRSFTINESHFASCVWLGWWCGVQSFYPLIIYFIFLIFEPQNRTIHMLMSHIPSVSPKNRVVLIHLCNYVLFKAQTIQTIHVVCQELGLWHFSSGVVD